MGESPKKSYKERKKKNLGDKENQPLGRAFMGRESTHRDEVKSYDKRFEEETFTRNERLKKKTEISTSHCRNCKLENGTQRVSQTKRVGM